MRFLLLVFISFLISCGPVESKKVNTMEIENEPCLIRPKYSFKKITNRKDTLFLKFRSPIDSIESIISSYDLEPQKLRYMSDTNGVKNVWKNGDMIIKIENQFTLHDRPIFHKYYIQDKCYWFFERTEYHESNTDSLIHCELYYYNDTTILNTFVGTAVNECAFMVNVDSNRFSTSKAKQVAERFNTELELLSK